MLPNAAPSIEPGEKLRLLPNGKIIDEEASMEIVYVEKTQGADTRSAKEVVSKETLLRESHLHRSHVRKVMAVIAHEIIKRGEKHDFTKIDAIDLFHDNFVKAFNKEMEFKQHDWWKLHMTDEKHHILDYLHEDTDLLDLIEMIVDSVSAGTARTGSVYPITLDNDKLQKILANTVEKIKAIVKPME